MSTIDRRALLKFSGAGLVALSVPFTLTACGDDNASGSAPAGSDANALEETKVRIFSVKDAQTSGQLAYAVAKDLFKAEGLDVTVDYTLNGIDAASLAASGGVQLMAGGVDQCFALRQQNIDFKFLLKLCEIQGAQAVVLKPGLTLAAPKDIEGKRIGMYKGAAIDLAIRNFCKAHGVDFSKITFVNLEAPEQVIAIQKGDVDIMAAWEPYVSAGVNAGGTVYFRGNKSFVNGREEDVNWLYAAIGLMVSSEYMNKAPNTLMAIMRVLTRATKDMNADLEAASKVVGPQLTIPEETALESLKVNRFDNTADEQFFSGVDDFLVWASEQGFLDQVYKTREGVDFDLLNKVDPSLTPAS